MPSAAQARLDQALARDLRRLAQLSSAADARFEIAGAELGDLDRDGDDDAAVLLNYLSGRPGIAQFLMTYRFDGDTFHPAAKTYLGGLGADMLARDIERIDEGTIELLLQMRQQGDQECCPSGSPSPGLHARGRHSGRAPPRQLSTGRRKLPSPLAEQVAVSPRPPPRPSPARGDGQHFVRGALGVSLASENPLRHHGYAGSNTSWTFM